MLFKSSDATRLSSWWSKHHVKTLVKLGQHHIRIYLSFVFAKELTKLLSKLKSSLKDHFNGVELQMRVARGDDSGGRPQGSVGGLAKATTILTKTTAAADPAPTKVTARARANSFILKQQQQQQWLCEQQQV